MLEPLVSMHMWMYSCIMWQSTVARCALQHAFQNMDIHSIHLNVYV